MIEQKRKPNKEIKSNLMNSQRVSQTLKELASKTELKRKTGRAKL